jgi:hypothetical protein
MFSLLGLQPPHPSPSARFILDRTAFIFYCEDAEVNICFTSPPPLLVCQCMLINLFITRSLPSQEKTYETSLVAYDTVRHINVSSSGHVQAELSSPPFKSGPGLARRQSLGDGALRMTLELGARHAPRLHSTLRRRGLVRVFDAFSAKLLPY